MTPSPDPRPPEREDRAELAPDPAPARPPVPDAAPARRRRPGRPSRHMPAAGAPAHAAGVGMGRLTSIQREELRRRRRAALRHRRIAVLVCFAAIVFGIVEVVSSGGAHPAGATRGADAGASSGAPSASDLAASQVPPVARLVVGAPRAVTVPGAKPAIAWPPTGEAAVGVLGMGVMAASKAERSAPIASMTKMMTALVVLRDHPLAVGQPGPELTMTAADYDDYVHASQSDDSNVPVRRGERLSELQLLEALLIPSGDNIADTLAVWDAGSVKAFVAKMNATAHALGLRDTHYGDPAGLSVASRSTASDQVVVAEALMSVPALRFVVSQSHVAFPVAGTIWNFNPALGVDGIVGIKSGFTQPAQGCLSTAAYEVVGGRNELVVAVSLHQPDGLYGAAQADEALLTQADRALRPVAVLAGHVAVAPVVVPWSGRRLEAFGPAGVVEVPGWGGLRLLEQVVAGPLLHAGVPAGAYAGRLVLTAPAAAPVVAVTAPALLAGPLTAASSPAAPQPKVAGGTPATGTGASATAASGAAASAAVASVVLRLSGPVPALPGSAPQPVRTAATTPSTTP